MSTQRASLPIDGLQHQNDSRLFKGRLAGERFYSLSTQGEQVPFRRIKLSPTPEAFGGQKQPSIYLNDVTGPFGEETSDILPNKPGVYRFFYEDSIDGEKVPFMATFELK